MHRLRFRLRHAAVLVLLAACGARETASPTDSARESAGGGVRVDLTGAGATFPYPLYSRWFNDYAQRANVRINYLSVGSGNGMRRLLDGTVDFGATESPMTDAELAQSPVPIVHVPTVLGAVAITYNLPELRRPLRLSGEVIADIFLGRVTRWNDAANCRTQPGRAAPRSRRDGGASCRCQRDLVHLQ